MTLHRLPVASVFGAAMAWSAAASGPESYETPFTQEVDMEAVLAGNLPPRLRSDDALFSLIVYLHLRGRFTDDHAALFRSWRVEHKPRDLSADGFWRELGEEGYERPAAFGLWKYGSVAVEDPSDGDGAQTVSYYFRNCLPDAFKTASATLAARKERYGSGAAELSRWIEAQVAVFSQCGGDAEFTLPEEPAPGWLALEKHDRRYQIAAAHFYAGRFVEAASLFAEIGRTEDSPWRDLGRYLVARSLLREASLHREDSPAHLRLALDAYRELAADAAYVAAFPSVVGQIRHIRAKLDPVGVRREIEQRILHEPAAVSEEDLADYIYLLPQTQLAEKEAATDYERWRWYAADERSIGAEAAQRWREERSVPWLYAALARVSSDMEAATLGELLEAAGTFPPNNPGHLTVLLQRIRILALLGRPDEGLRLAQHMIDRGLGRSDENRVRLAAAGLATSWPEYLRWASLKPLSLPWTDDFARRLPPHYNRITRNTALFGQETTRLVNRYFTPSMIEAAIDAPDLSDYQRGRLAIAGWTKAMLGDDIAAALRLAGHIRRHVPWLDRELAQFEQGEDKHFEAARVIFDYPAFSPWLEPGAGRVYTGETSYRAMPDHVTRGATWPSWWCVQHYSDEAGEPALRGPRFRGFSDTELAAIRRIVDLRKTAATTSFGWHVIDYAKDHLDDPRVPRALHRLVFATRHACWLWSAPGNVSRTAHALLHEHFPGTEWAAKTPHWYGKLE